MLGGQPQQSYLVRYHTSHMHCAFSHLCSRKPQRMPLRTTQKGFTTFAETTAPVCPRGRLPCQESEDASHIPRHNLTH